MHGLITNRVFPTSETLLEGAGVPAGIQTAAEQSVARFRDLYRQSMATAQGSAKVFAEVAETTWGSAKLLNDKLIQNVTANTEAAFSAAESIARARSLPEAARLQGDFLQMLLVVTGEQVKEFIDLSARAAQHVLETTQVAARRSMQSDL
jgi:hypothetical protein